MSNKNIIRPERIEEDFTYDLEKLVNQALADGANVDRVVKRMRDTASYISFLQLLTTNKNEHTH